MDKNNVNSTIKKIISQSKSTSSSASQKISNVVSTVANKTTPTTTSPKIASQAATTAQNASQKIGNVASTIANKTTPTTTSSKIASQAATTAQNASQKINNAASTIANKTAQTTTTTQTAGQQISNIASTIANKTTTTTQNAGQKISNVASAITNSTSKGNSTTNTSTNTNFGINTTAANNSVNAKLQVNNLATNKTTTQNTSNSNGILGVNTTAAAKPVDAQTAANNTSKESQQTKEQTLDSGYKTTSTKHKKTKDKESVGLVDFVYNEKGYNEGLVSYNKALEIVKTIQEKILTAEKTVKENCMGPPEIDYLSIIEFNVLKEIVTSMKDLLEKTKTVIENEKYIADRVDKKDSKKLSKFQAAVLAIGTVNYAFQDPEELKKLINAYQKSGSKSDFSKWFQSYVSKNGISSKVINMGAYEKAIKETGANSSSNYVVSKVGFGIPKDSPTPTNKVTPTPTKTKTEKIEPTPEPTEITKPTEETPTKVTPTPTEETPKEPTKQEIVVPTEKTEEVVEKEITITPEETPTPTEIKQTTTVETVQQSAPPPQQQTVVQETHNESYNNESVADGVQLDNNTIKEITEEKPTTTNITTNDSIDTTEDVIKQGNVIKIPTSESPIKATTSSKGNSFVPIAAGLTAAAAAGIGAKAYLDRKKNNDNDLNTEDWSDENSIEINYDEGKEKQEDTLSDDDEFLYQEPTKESYEARNNNEALDLQ